MLKLYTDITFLIEEHRRDIFPLLFDLVYKKNENLLPYYQLVNTAEECDIVVFPIDYVKFLKFIYLALCGGLLDDAHCCSF